MINVHRGVISILNVFTYPLSLAISIVDFALMLLIKVFTFFKTTLQKKTLSQDVVFIKEIAQLIEDQTKKHGITSHCFEVNQSPTNEFTFVFKIDTSNFDDIKSMLAHQEALKIIPLIQSVEKTDNGFKITFRRK